MKILYILLHIATFIGGCYINKEMSCFMMLIFIDCIILFDKYFKASQILEDKMNDFVRWMVME